MPEQQATATAGAIFLAAILANNILLSDFLGMCSFLGVSSRMKTALGMGGAVVFVMTCTTVINYAIRETVLLPLGLDHLRLIVFIAVIAGFVQLVEMVIERFSPALYYNLGIFLPLITVNCAILGASSFMVLRGYAFWQTLAYGSGSGIGFAAAICAMAGIRERLAVCDVPRPLRGVAITLIVTAMMAMIFMGFSDLGSIR